MVGTHERQSYLPLTGEVSFLSYLEKTDRDVSGSHCNMLFSVIDSSEGKLVINLKK